MSWPCASLADKEAYGSAIKGVVTFLDGKQEAIVKSLRRQMEDAAEVLQFERAAVFRDRVRTLERVLEQQKVFSTATTDEDVIAFAKNESEACVQIFFIRGGKLLGREHVMLEGTVDSTPSEILGSFMGQFYDDAAYIPQKILLQDDVSDAEVIQTWLREKRGNKVSISVPRRGEKRDLIEMAARNASESLEQYRLRWLSDEQKSTAALTELQEALHLPVWPRRIECYDVAHLQGTDVAGAMVVFEQGTPKKKEYRRFSIRNSSNDDFASMAEMLSRRFKRQSAEKAARQRVGALAIARSGDMDEPAPSAGYEALTRLAEEASEGATEPQLGDSLDRLASKAQSNSAQNGGEQNGAEEGGWAVLPDLMVIDGGKGQLAAAVRVLHEAGLTEVPVISLAKQREEVFMPGQSQPILLPARSEALKLLQRIRDEAHRFSNTYNRKLGMKRATRGQLDNVALIGPVRKKALMRHFGSLKAIKAATLEQLLAVQGMDRAAALSIKENL